MKELRNVWRTLGKIFLAIGVSLLVLYIILGLAVNFLYMLALGINSAVFIIMGAVFWLIAQSGDAKRARLTRDGLCFDAEIVNILPNMRMNVGRAVAANAECRYLNWEGKTCLVKSGLFLIDAIPPTVFSGGPHPHGGGAAGLTAKVYVNKSNPRDYYVEISDKGRNTGADADYDYR